MKYYILFYIRKIFEGIFLSLCKNEEFLINGTSESSGTFVDIINDEHYSDYRKRLLKNLDLKSKKIVSLALKRIENYKNHNKRTFVNSLDEICRLRKAVKQKKMQLKSDENFFSYGKYKLSRCHFNNEIFYDKYFINEFSSKTLKHIKNKNIIDVGGFIGDTAVVFSDYTHNSVYVFEPVKSNYVDLLKTIELNKSKKILPFKLGLGSEKKDCIININDTTGVGSTTRNDICFSEATKQEKIDITTLDDFVENENIEVGLIKVDIEGAEQDFLKGAMKTITSQKPALLIAIYHTGEDFFIIKSKLEDLNLGYKFKIRKAAKNRLIEDTVLIGEVCDV